MSGSRNKHALVFVVITVLVDIIGFGLILPVLPRLLASLYSLSSIVGPPLMTQLFGRFTAPQAPVRIPGAAFFASALLAWLAFAIYFRATRKPRPREA